MFGMNRNAPVAENEASDDIERVYHEIRQVLRVSGVNLNFRTWAGFGRSFPLLWEAIRENVATRAFEDAADELRREAVRSAMELPAVRAIATVPLGGSQLYQIGAALALYHYINPKLLLLTAAVRLALEEDPVTGSPSADTTQLPRGVPPRMYPMEMVDEDAGDPRVGEVFADIRETFALESINSDYRTLALWPDYFVAAWAGLKPIVSKPEYGVSTAMLGQRAVALARGLPYRVKLSRLDIATVGEDDDRFVEVTRSFERILPPLIVNVALLTLEGVSADVCMESPFPVARAGGAPQ